MTAILILALSSLFVFAAGWHHERLAHHRTKRAHARTYAALVAREEELARVRSDLEESEAYREAVKQSALRGAPVVKWFRDLAQGLPNGADFWYWKTKIDGRWRLFTDEELNRRPLERAQSLLASEEAEPAGTVSTS